MVLTSSGVMRLIATQGGLENATLHKKEKKEQKKTQKAGTKNIPLKNGIFCFHYVY